MLNTGDWVPVDVPHNFTGICRLFTDISTHSRAVLDSFQLKTNKQTNSEIFHISAQNIDCAYSLEPPRRGGSNEYP